MRWGSPADGDEVQVAWVNGEEASLDVLKEDRRRDTKGSSQRKLPDECDWVVWIDPPPTELVGQAFEELHGGLERSWIKACRMEKKVMDLNNENKKMQLKLQKRNELMETMGFLFVLGIIIVASLVSI
ncbi:hypothetical protein D1007_34907 [Hordeum vulgare]|nr:hypothetical protein D1007_34907 [Hordeum vulgare]